MDTVNQHFKNKMSHAESLKPGFFHHFEPEQAYHACKLGMWFFIATEVLLFTALFAAFAVIGYRYEELFIDSAAQLNWKLGMLNTGVLLASSWTMVRGVDAAQRGSNEKCNFWLTITTILALGFFVVKGIEYSSKFSHDIYISTNVFWAFYYTMTGIHAFHVLIGVGMLLWLKGLCKKGIFSETYYTPVEIGGLYWHLVDLVWIYLFPIVYLYGHLTLNGAGH